MSRYKNRILTSIFVILIAMVLCACGIDSSTVAGSASQINQYEQEDTNEESAAPRAVEIDEEAYEEAADDELDVVEDFEEPSEEQEDIDQGTHRYVLNTNTMKFHEPGCRSVGQMKDKNKLIEDTTREVLSAEDMILAVIVIRNVILSGRAT